MAAGLARAAAVVVSYHDTPSALKILHLVQEHAPQVPVIVRTVDDSDIDKLRAAGATEVVPEAIEGSLMLASHALALMGVPMRRVVRIARDARDARYGLLRGYFHGADDDTVEELHQARLQSVTVRAWRVCVGQTLDSLALPALGVGVVSIRHASGGVRRRYPSTCWRQAIRWCFQDCPNRWHWRGETAARLRQSRRPIIRAMAVDPVASPAEYIRSHIRTVPDWPAPGVMFRDITPLLSQPRVFRVLIDQFVHRYFDVRPNVIAGLDARGFIIGSVVAYELNVGFVPSARKASCPSPRSRKPTNWSTAARRSKCTPTPSSRGTAWCSSTTSSPPAAP